MSAIFIYLGKKKSNIVIINTKNGYTWSFIDEIIYLLTDMLLELKYLIIWDK